MAKPTVAELTLSLKNLVRLEQFAVHLPEIESYNIDMIKKDNPCYVEDQKRVLFDLWLRKCPSASWKHVVNALERMDEIVIASGIRSSYNIPSSNLSTAFGTTQSTITPQKESTANLTAIEPLHEEPDTGQPDKKQRKPKTDDVFKLLGDKSAQWDSIGRELGVSLNKRESLQRNPSLNSKGRLERVINVWLEQDKDATWAKLVECLKKIKLMDIVETIIA